MKNCISKNLRRFTRSRGGGLWPACALVFALSAGGHAARAQTVGPIFPNPSKTPQQAPARTTTPAPAISENAKDSLAGTWKLNRDQSDDPRQKLEQASNTGRGGWGQGPSVGGGGWGGWGGPGTGRGGGWNRAGSPIPEESSVDMSDFSQLTIEQSDSSAKVTGATGRVLARYTSDTAQNASDKSDKVAAKKSKESSNAPVAAHWEGDRLVTTGNEPRGVRNTRTYELSSDGRQLYVTTRLESSRFNQPVSIRFVYDPARPTGN